MYVCQPLTFAKKQSISAHDGIYDYGQTKQENKEERVEKKLYISE